MVVQIHRNSHYRKRDYRKVGRPALAANRNVFFGAKQKDGAKTWGTYPTVLRPFAFSM